MSMTADTLRDAMKGRVNHPRMHHTALARLSDASNGITLWAHTTKHSLTEVMEANGAIYFADACYSLREHDRVLLTCSADAAPVYVDLVVTHSAEPVVELAVLQRYPVERD